MEDLLCDPIEFDRISVDVVVAAAAAVFLSILYHYHSESTPQHHN